MKEQIYSVSQIKELVEQLAQAVLKGHPSLSDVALIGIRTGGVYLAQRLQRLFEEHVGHKVPLGVLDINLYRDDFDLGKRQPEVRRSEIGFSVDEMVLILVDDVLFTGRTIRAALEAINDYGRPAAVRLAVLIDRGHRELPIQPDYVAAQVQTTRRERIKVLFSEQAGEDRVERILLPE